MELTTKKIAKGNIEGNFAKVPMELYDYIQLEIISHRDAIVYVKLYDLYNEEYGYAYPTIPQLMTSTGIRSKATIHRCLKNLDKVGLIEKRKTKWGNNTYLVYKPLEKNELYKYYPDKLKEFKKFEAKVMDIAENDKARFQYHNQQSLEQPEIYSKQIMPKMSDM